MLLCGSRKFANTGTRFLSYCAYPLTDVLAAASVFCTKSRVIFIHYSIIRVLIRAIYAQYCYSG